jgi:hypothetical protein
LEAVEIEGSNVGEVMGNLIARYGELKRHLYTEDGKLRNFVNVYLNDEDVRTLPPRQQHPRGRTSRHQHRSRYCWRVVSMLNLDTSQVSLSREEMERFSRHLILPEVGLEGQKRLKAGKVLCIGTGGLGSPPVAVLGGSRRGADRHRRF